MKINKYEKCSCVCHYNLQEHPDLYGVRYCDSCKCDKSVVINSNNECKAYQ